MGFGPCLIRERPALALLAAEVLKTSRSGKLVPPMLDVCRAKFVRSFGLGQEPRQG